MTRFLDTNVLVRYLTNDNPVHSPAAAALMERIATGEEDVWITDLVIAELVFVLSSKASGYALDRSAIRNIFESIIAFPGIILLNKSIYPRVFDLYVSQNVDFADAYHAARIERREDPSLYSFDRDFDRLPGLTRIEPAVPGPDSVPPDAEQ